jgi:CubicO group peptidase (beta-lactamase class C family)
MAKIIMHKHPTKRKKSALAVRRVAGRTVPTLPPETIALLLGLNNGQFSLEAAKQRFSETQVQENGAVA